MPNKKSKKQIDAYRQNLIDETFDFTESLLVKPTDTLQLLDKIDNSSATKKQINEHIAALAEYAALLRDIQENLCSLRDTL